MHSIRFKLTAITIAAILVTILTVLAVCYPSIQAENDRRSVELMNLLAQDTAKSLESYFSSIEQSIEMIANIATDTLDSITLAECGVTVTALASGERSYDQTSALNSYLSGYCARVRETAASVANHTYGIVTYYFCIQPEISTVEHGFFYSKVGRSGFAEQPSLDARELDPEDMEHTTWYYTPIRRGRPSWVGPYTAHFLNEMWICSYLVPIYRSGVLIGVLGMDIPCDTLIAMVSPIRLFKTGFACLLNEDGLVVYHPDLPIDSEPDLEGLSVKNDILTQEDSSDQLIRYNADGQKRQMSFTTLSNGMKLVITAPTDEISASSREVATTLLIISVAIVIFFTLLLLFLLRLTTRPLLKLTSAARRLAAADYDVDLDYHSRDEVGVLTDSFIQMRDQLKLHIEDLNHQINYDALTDLPNMRHFYVLAEAHCDHLLAEGKRPVMLFFDLIGMKHYNRLYGFDGGDRLLCAFSDLLVQYYGKQCVGRVGQDHFAAVSEEAGLQEGLQEFFRDCAGLLEGRSLPVRVGIYPEALEHVGASVAVDRAKYACDQYRGSYVSSYYYFNTTLQRQDENVRYIITHLDQALEEHWIKVFYQPIVRAESGRVCDEEALARWDDPAKGMLSPGEFIPILERARLIWKLDLFVLDQVLEKIRFQEFRGLSVASHSINLSRSDFSACDIVEEIRKRVDAAGIRRNKIAIEITETIIGSDYAFMKEQVERFHALGFPVWMDDFGSGYSSLDVLQSIQFDTIKFDMSFMQRLDEGDRGRIILRDLMHMAAELGVDTVCEGVETEAQLAFLKEIGCRRMQGYYFCRPVPLETILERYEKGTQIGYDF